MVTIGSIEVRSVETDCTWADIWKEYSLEALLALEW